MSPIPAGVVARSAVSYDALQSVGETVYWIEGRPDGDMLVRWSRSEGCRDVLPEGFRVGSRVHEYGGGAYLASERGYWLCNADDQRIYHFRSGEVPLPVTQAPRTPRSLRYADLRLIPSSRMLVCVRERHEAPAVRNELVVLPADGSAEPRIIASGDDFFMSPAPSPDGKHLAWVSWDAPLMPWDGSRLWLAEIRGDGTLGHRRLVAGGENESVCQPQWDARGTLYFVSDRSGWWNLYALRDGHSTPGISGDFELAAAPWEFGYRTYALDDQRIIAIAQRGPEHFLMRKYASGEVQWLPLPYTSMKPYLATAGVDAMVIASSATRLPEVVKVAGDGSVDVVAQTGFAPTDSLSLPERFTFTCRDGAQAHGLYYGPTAEGYGAPPLIVRAHPGPTANWPLRLDLHAQFFTSRGFAVADVDYRGSTGYGRAYRLQLRRRWGETDATDCADAALHLSATGRADRDRMAIWGASAGGLTVLAALSATDVFARGIARSAIVDPRAWAREAPKFQAHHHVLLAADVPRLSPKRPLLLIHGHADDVTPLDQVRALARERPTSTLVVIPGGGHSFSRPADIESVLSAELEHLRPMTRQG